MGHPVARLEIDRVQRPAPAAPVIGAAAQEAQAAAIQRGIGDAALAAAIKRLVLGVEIHPAGFQQQDFMAAARQRQGQRYAGRPAADDRQVGGKDRSGGKAAGVEDGGQNNCPENAGKILGLR